MPGPTTLVPVTDAEFAQFVKQHPHIVIDAWAPWCPPLQTASRFGIMSLPTIMVFKDGQRVDQFVGFAPKDTLRQRFSRSFGF